MTNARIQPTAKNIHKGESNNHFSLWIQKMKVPPLGEKEILNAATVTPMFSSAWQAKQETTCSLRPVASPSK